MSGVGAWEDEEVPVLSDIDFYQRDSRGEVVDVSLRMGWNGMAWAFWEWNNRLSGNGIKGLRRKKGGREDLEIHKEGGSHDEDVNGGILREEARGVRQV